MNNTLIYAITHTPTLILTTNSWQSTTQSLQFPEENFFKLYIYIKTLYFTKNTSSHHKWYNATCIIYVISLLDEALDCVFIYDIERSDFSPRY